MQQETTRKHASWKSENHVSEINLGAALGGGIFPTTGWAQKIKGLANGV